MKRLAVCQMVILCILLAIVLLGICRFERLLSDVYEKHKVEEDSQGFERAYMEENLYEAAINNGLPLEIPEIKSDSVALICYYSSLSCSSCVNFAKSKLEDFASQNTRYPVCFIAAGFDEKQQIGTNIIKWPDRKMKIPLAETLQVFYFLWQNGHITNCFIPNENHANYTDIYLSGIRKRYFTQP